MKTNNLIYYELLKIIFHFEENLKVELYESNITNPRKIEIESDLLLSQLNEICKNKIIQDYVTKKKYLIYL